MRRRGANTLADVLLGLLIEAGTMAWSFVDFAICRWIFGWSQMTSLAVAVISAVALVLIVLEVVDADRQGLRH